MKIRCFILFFVLLFPTNNLFSQFRFEHLDITDGLTENSVTDIFQDSEGYMWFATQDGISQYNGYDFKNYEFSNDLKTSLSDNFLWSIAEDENGFIWCCSRNGLNRINKKTGECKRFFKQQDIGAGGNNQTYSVVYFDGWIYASLGMEIYKIPSDYIPESYDNILDKSYSIKVDTSFGSLLSFIIDTVNNKIYNATSKGIVNIESLEFVQYPKNRTDQFSIFFSYVQNMDGTIWFTNASSVYYFKDKLKNLTEFKHNIPSQTTIHDLAFCENILWIATNRGVYLYKENNLLYHIKNEGDSKYGISSDNIEALYTDYKRRIWIGTAGNGINIYNPNQEKFKFLDSHIFGDDYIIRSVARDSKNRYFVCTNKSIFLIELLPGKQFTDFTFASNAIANIKEIKIPGFSKLRPNYVTIAKNGDVLISNIGTGLIILNNKLTLKKIVSFNNNNHYSNVVSDIVYRNNNELWVSTYRGLFQLNSNYEIEKSWFASDSTSGLIVDYYLDAYVDSENTLWLGSNQGMACLKNGKTRFILYPYRKNNLSESPGFNFVSGFHDFGDGNLWIASFGGGLSKLNKQTNRFTHYTTSEGLSNNVCNGMVASNNKYLWISTNKGINRFNINTNKILNFLQTDGVHFNEFNLHAAYKNNSNEIFFGTPKSLVLFNPEDITISNFQPNIVLEEIFVNYETATKRLINNNLDLYPKDKVIAFDFVGFNYSKSPKIKYKYKLVNFDENWINTDVRNLHASYTHLPSGKYVFLAKCTNEDGIWSDNHLHINLIVHPPFYKTLWFFLIANFIGIGIFIMIIRYFSQRKIKQQMRELIVQQKIQQEKERISRDLHDNIGSQITYLISSVDQQVYSNKYNKEIFNQIGDGIRNIMTLLRQTIWIIKKEEISLKEFEQKVTDYVNRMLENFAIESEIKFNGNEEIILSPTIVMNLFRMIQESVNNVMKHANATLIEISISGLNKIVNIEVSDNGIGMNELKNLEGHYGLKNMKIRTEELNGVFKIKSDAKVGGTIVSFQIPINSENK